MANGGCHCGAVRYAIEGEMVYHAVCHCEDCRRSAGALMVPWMAFPKDALKVESGAPTVYRSSENGERHLRNLRNRPVLLQRDDPARDCRHTVRDARRYRRANAADSCPGRRQPAMGSRARFDAALRPLSRSLTSPSIRQLRQGPRSPTAGGPTSPHRDRLGAAIRRADRFRQGALRRAPRFGPHRQPSTGGGQC
jgi:hypothetical protein